MDEKTWFDAIVESQIPTVTVPPRALTQSSWHKNIFELCYTLIMITYFYKKKYWQQNFGQTLFYIFLESSETHFDLFGSEIEVKLNFSLNYGHI